MTKLNKDYILCEAYKSGPDEETYLFVDHQDGFDRVPEELMLRFKEPILVTRFKLSPDRSLARADPKAVLEAIQSHGFYLQLPPPKDLQMGAISARNEKLPRS